MDEHRAGSRVVVLLVAVVVGDGRRAGMDGRGEDRAWMDGAQGASSGM